MAIDFFGTLWGELTTRGSHPYYSDLIAPGFPQPHKKRDGIPWSGLLPTLRIDAPSNPNLTLNIVTATTWYLGAVGRDITAPVRETLTPYSRKAAHAGEWGNSRG